MLMTPVVGPTWEHFLFLVCVHTDTPSTRVRTRVPVLFIIVNTGIEYHGIPDYARTGTLTGSAVHGAPLQIPFPGFQGFRVIAISIHA